MELKSIVEAVKNAAPEERAALRGALDPPAGPQSRTEMPAAERRALGAMLVSLAAGYERRRDELQRAIAASQEKHRDLDREQGELGGELAGLGDGYCSQRDPIMARLWAERPAWADELIARVEEEAVAILRNPQLRELPADAALFVASNPRVTGEIVDENAPLSVIAQTFSNSASCEVRSRALRDLAQQVRSWTEKGAYSTPAELEAMFGEAYAALPAIEGVDSVVESEKARRRGSLRRVS